MADDASRGANPAIAVDAAAPAPVRVADAIPPAVAAAIASAAGTPGPGTGTVTPALSEMQPEQAEHSLRVSLADLCAKGAAHYAHKSYEDAAEVYSRATEMQAEMNGEMSPANAEILFLYGRSLFKVGQSKSDVLGGKAPEAKKEPAAKKLKNGAAKAKPSSSGAAGPIAAALAVGQDAEAPQTEAQRITEEGVAIIAAGTEAGKEEAAAVEAKKPLFQFQGDDENWDESEEEEDAPEEGEEEGEEEDDLAVAFEILDMARVLFNKRLSDGDQESVEGKGKAKAEDDSPEVRHIKERLADTHDLLAEISLENERYPNAITDFEAALRFKQELFPKESEIIAEAHYKLSLALEFASVTTTEDDKPAGAAGESAKEQPSQQVDQELRDRAATQLEAAIESTQLKLQSKEVDLATIHSPDENEATRKQIAEVKDIIADMEQRLVELRKPPMDINAAVNGPAAAVMGGILGAALGETADEAQTRIAEAKKKATDLTGLVRKKAKADEPSAANGSETNGGGKRKARDVEDASESDSKKARVEDAVEA